MIQRNAIESWTRLEPRPQIILFGQESGTAEAAREFGLTHLPRHECNQHGTPLVSDLLRQGETHSRHGLLCYVNADIILMGDFMDAVRRVADYGRPFLMGARRWDADIQEALAFRADWEAGLRRLVTERGRLDPPGSIDFFLFPNGFWGHVPPFAIGRFYWDNWLLHESTRRGVLIDATDAVMIVHQRHGYNQASLGTQGVQQSEGTAVLRLGPEALRNLEMAGGEHHLYTLKDATHRLTACGVERRPLGPDTVERWQISWNVGSRRALRALEEAALPTSYFGYPARALLGLVRAAAPARQWVGRAITVWRDAGKGTP